ncbi:MAG: NAD(P)-dependent dehydrogenase (short-subunit alcohol dehydrogenase family) [Halieaceae bacterium]|jgi:NAD(P)-dependent dehydrogenase (short-subunit alcohol dehydrogenase family)
MANRLDGKVAVITGASSGIGAATAHRFVAEGCRVVLGDIQEDQGRELAETLGSGAVFAVCNVTNEDDVATLVDLAVSTFGQLDIMFNNAGIVGSKGPIHTTPAGEWIATLNILINGVFYGVKHAARVMRPQESGSIINMSSVAGVIGGLAPHAYTVAKHAVVGLTKSTSSELCTNGIRVNAIAPYSMATPMVADAHLQDPQAVEQTARNLAENSPLTNRAGTAEDVANAALWLASDESGFTSGLTLTTDAGVTSGSLMRASRYAEYSPMQKEAGKKGL